MTIKINNIIRSKRKTVSLEITPEAKIVIKAPHYVSINYIEDFVLRKKDWIIQKLKIIKKKNESKSKKNLLENGKLIFLGQEYYYILSPKNKKIIFKEKLIIPFKYKNELKKHLIDWYKKQSKVLITRRVDELAKKYNYNYKKIRISNARTRWGSCSGENNLNFAWRLIMAPIEIIDYVIIHELVHTEIKNHSRAYWNMVMSICNECKNYRKWLKDNGHLLEI